MNYSSKPVELEILQERITLQIGRGKFSTLTTPVTDTATANRKVHRADSLVLALNPAITDTAAQLSYHSTLTNHQKDTCEAYGYHTDHLGSSSWVTDSAGNPVQHLHYLPWGEDFVNQRSTSWNAMYTFSAKEKDIETGYSYFGARYYSSDLSVWLSVDPMSDSIPYMTPYNYCKNSPILMKDPNGEFPWLAVWGVIEVGLAIYDAYQTGATIIDKNASLGEKIAAGFGFVVGAALPGGGYGTVSKEVAGEAAKQF